MLSTFKYLKVLDPGLIKTFLVETKCISWELLDQSFICSFNNELLSEDNHYWVTFMLLFSQFYVLLVSTSPQRVCSLWFLSMWSFNMIPLQQFHTTLTSSRPPNKTFSRPWVMLWMMMGVLCECVLTQSPLPWPHRCPPHRSDSWWRGTPSPYCTSPTYTHTQKSKIKHTQEIIHTKE